MIKSFHAHVYFRDAAERLVAEDLRAQISAEFSVQMGRWHDRLIGPHARPMYQIAFATELFADFVPWLMLNRQNLAILLHPNTGHPRRDHLFNAVWFGEMLAIENIADLPEDSDADETVVPNTRPI